jgi:hypothetical protein
MLGNSLIRGKQHLSQLNRYKAAQARLKALERKVRILSSLRRLARLPPNIDISEHQWHIIQSQLADTERGFSSRINTASKRYLPNIDNIETARQLDNTLNQINLDLVKSTDFFDTFLDILSQRHVSKIGRMLRGCDELASDAIRRARIHRTSVIEPPIVFLDRGFGSNILKEGLKLPDWSRISVPLIPIRYQNLYSKYDLTSVLHEVGHQIMVRLGLVSTLRLAIRRAFSGTGVSEIVRDLFTSWSTEIFPDFWTFLNSGVAQTLSIRDVVSVPDGLIFRLSLSDPHPPPYVRVILSIAFCRYIWGNGIWDQWEEDWIALHPLRKCPIETRKTLEHVINAIPLVSKTMITTRFQKLTSKTLSSLFDMDLLSPSRLNSYIYWALSGRTSFGRLSPCTQLATFRLLRDTKNIDEEELDGMMTKWLEGIGNKRTTTSQRIH